MEEWKYRGKFVQVSELKKEGKVWEKVYLPHAVVVFPITTENEIVMVLESRPHETPDTRLKFVTGHIDHGETPLKTAAREIQEEVGFKADSFEEIMVHSSTGTVNSKFYYYLASELSLSKLPNPDGEDTILEIRKIQLKELKRMFYAGEIHWGLATLGIFRIFERFGV